MKIDILTIFPDAVRSYFDSSIMSRARDAGIIAVELHDIREHSTDNHKNVDATPYGGGAGMVMQVEPIYRCVESVKQSDASTRIILLSAKGKRFLQSDAQRLKSYDQLIFICGRYEGVDERVAEHIADEEISIGDYVLTGGELGAAVVADSVVRLLPDVLGNSQSAVHESHAQAGYKEHPQYAKPEKFNGWSVPEVLLSGNHALIEKWRNDESQN